MAEKFLFEIVTPARMMRSEEVDLVVIPGGGGNFGVLAGHAPMLSTLRPGTIEILDKNLKVLDQIFVEQGFAEVTPEGCTVLAEEAMRVDEITRDCLIGVALPKPGVTTNVITGSVPAIRPIVK